MASSKKPSGLGRGLDDLLDDNTPALRKGKPLVEARGEATTPNKVIVNGEVIKPKALYNTKPQTKSLKANFKK